MLRDHKTILFLAPCRVALNINVSSGTADKPFYSIVPVRLHNYKVILGPGYTHQIIFRQEFNCKWLVAQLSIVLN